MPHTNNPAFDTIFSDLLLNPDVAMGYEWFILVRLTKELGRFVSVLKFKLIINISEVIITTNKISSNIFEWNNLKII